MSDNFIGYKIPIYPDENQRKEFNKYFGACRTVYNLCIDLQEDHYNKNKNSGKRKSLTFYSMNNKLTALKKTDEYSWLNEYDSTSLKQTAKDCKHAYDNFFDSRSKYPNYKTKKKSKMQFPIRSDRLKITNSWVRIPSIGKVRCHNTFPELNGNGRKDVVKGTYIDYQNARISYDGINYWLSVSTTKTNTRNTNSFKNHNTEDFIIKESSKPIGIDLGCKGINWIVDSSGERISLPDFSKEEKKLRKFHKKHSRQLKVNNKKQRESSCMSKNEQKTIKEINKYHKRIVNKRKSKIYEYCKTLIDKKPKAIVLETPSVMDMLVSDKTKMCNKEKERRNHKVLLSALYETSNIIYRTVSSNGIQVIYADTDFPSSQLCSSCGHRQKIGNKRTYKCENCGNVIDRDLNASINLSKLAMI